MIKEVNKICRKLNKILRISIILPTPSKKKLKTAMVCNLSVGVSLIAAGIVLSSKWCASLGCLGIVSSAILRKEQDVKNND